MSDIDDNDADDYPPALEDAEIDDADLDEDDISSDASVVTDSSDSISVDSDTLEAAYIGHIAASSATGPALMGDGEVVIHRFNKLMDHGIEEGDEEAEESSDDEKETVELTGDHKRRRRVVENGHESFTVTLGEPIVLPLKTDSDDEDDNLDTPSPIKRIGRRQGRSREEALERNMVRRQSSNEMLQAMQNSTRHDSRETDSESRCNIAHSERPMRKPPARTKSGEAFNRRPPQRTKSGDGPTTVEFHRRPPTRAKSGEPGANNIVERRAPPRTKSGDVFLRENGRTQVANQPLSRLQRAREQQLAKATSASTGEIDAPILHQDQNDVPILSPSGRRRRGIDKEMALKRNAARRQKSSDMLGAMRDATRQAPGRSKSSAAAFERRPPSRSKSGAGVIVDNDDEKLGSFGDGSSVRRPPLRTKSGDGRQSRTLGAPPIRRAPAHSKSGGILLPTQEEAEEDC
jgi:hypothetical protein